MLTFTYYYSVMVVYTGLTFTLMCLKCNIKTTLIEIRLMVYYALACLQEYGGEGFFNLYFANNFTFSH